LLARFCKPSNKQAVNKIKESQLIKLLLFLCSGRVCNPAIYKAAMFLLKKSLNFLLVSNDPALDLETV
jgi:hypothetical protein